jgi:hypothetical protein
LFLRFRHLDRGAIGFEDERIAERRLARRLRNLDEFDQLRPDSVGRPLRLVARAELSSGIERCTGGRLDSPAGLARGTGRCGPYVAGGLVRRVRYVVCYLLHRSRRRAWDLSGQQLGELGEQFIHDGFHSVADDRQSEDGLDGFTELRDQRAKGIADSFLKRLGKLGPLGL